MDKKLSILALLFFFSLADSAPLMMMPLESDIDSNITALWEKSVMQILREASFDPVKIEHGRFAECATIECAVSSARALGAQGLFRGRFKAEGKDSVSIRLRIDWLAGNTTPQTDVKIVAPLAWDEVLKSGVVLKLLSGITGKNLHFEPAKDRKAFIKVETNPDNAVVMLNGEAVCHSPCEFSDNSSVAQVSAYWHSGDNLWSAKKTIIPKDTVKIALELKRSFPSTEISSYPSGALVFPAGLLDVNSKALGKTPYDLRGLPGETQVRLFRKGYNDTLLNVRIDAVEKQVQHVQLTPVTDPQKISEQNLLAKSQLKRDVGLGLLGGSIGPFVAGSTLFILAHYDYKKASDIKKELEVPSFGGENFKARVEENHKAVKAGDSKMVFGAGLIGLSLLLAGIGFSISF
ncbi:MAG: PEGA domain-containing protein [Fibromonadales bacterium]|nr:PEGA domain-containing protein [Fibromonadales bacterium]